MGWSLGYDDNWQRDIGYGVPATCDHPGCTEVIDRGLSHVCGEDPMGGEEGCGLYFCESHRQWGSRPLVEGGDPDDEELSPELCERCRIRWERRGDFADPFTPSPDHPRWVHHKVYDESWAQWRGENPKEAKELRKQAMRTPYVPEAVDPELSNQDVFDLWHYATDRTTDEAEDEVTLTAKQLRLLTEEVFTYRGIPREAP